MILLSIPRIFRFLPMNIRSTLTQRQPKHSRTQLTLHRDISQVSHTHSHYFTVAKLEGTTGFNSMMTHHWSRQGVGRQNVDELMLMLDEHLAWQADAEEQYPTLDRRASQGTLIVDWDGREAPKISYHGQSQSAQPIVENVGPTSYSHEKPKTMIQADGRHHQEPTRASRAKSRQAEPRPGERYEIEQAPPHPTKRVESYSYRTKSHVRHGSAHSGPSKTKQSPPTKPSRSFDASSRADDTRYGRVPSNHKSSRTSAYKLVNHSISKPNRPRRDSTQVHYHRNPDADPLQVQYNASRNEVYGHDPKTGFAYDYNSRVVHIHKSPTTSVASATSEYYEADAMQYNPNVPLKLVDKPLPLAPGESNKRKTVAGFVKHLLHKLDAMGILGHMRQQRERQRRSREWVGAGYVA